MISGLIATDQVALATKDLEVTLTVVENDDPNGVLGFPFLSRERVVAEDFLVNKWIIFNMNDFKIIKSEVKIRFTHGSTV